MFEPKVMDVLEKHTGASKSGASMVRVRVHAALMSPIAGGWHYCARACIFVA